MDHLIHIDKNNINEFILFVYFHSIGDGNYKVIQNSHLGFIYISALQISLNGEYKRDRRIEYNSNIIRSKYIISIQFFKRIPVFINQG